MSIELNCRGLACPQPVVETKRKLSELAPGEWLEVAVDSAIQVQNLLRLAANQGLPAASAQEGEHFLVTIRQQEGTQVKAQSQIQEQLQLQGQGQGGEQTQSAAERLQLPQGQFVVVFASQCMGVGAEELGATLLKGYIYALSQQEAIPSHCLFYNSAVYLCCQDSACLADLRSLQERGVELLCCGACLDYYQLQSKLAVGRVSNMYEILDCQVQAKLVLKP